MRLRAALTAASKLTLRITLGGGASLGSDVPLRTIFSRIRATPRLTFDLSDAFGLIHSPTCLAFRRAFAATAFALRVDQVQLPPLMSRSVSLSASRLRTTLSDELTRAERTS